MNPVLIAVYNDHVDGVRALLEHNANPNQARSSDGTTPVFIPAQKGHVDGVRALLEHNANPNQATTDDGATPLHAAASEGKLSAAQLLVVHGANIAAVSFSGVASSFNATVYGRQQLAKWLDAVATWSPLRVAAALRMHGHACIAKLLQQVGLNLARRPRHAFCDRNRGGHCSISNIAGGVAFGKGRANLPNNDHACARCIVWLKTQHPPAPPRQREESSVCCAGG